MRKGPGENMLNQEQELRFCRARRAVIELDFPTLNPEQRVMLKVELTDAVEADRLFTILMGDKVEPRRKFIEDNAKNVSNLDL